MVQEELAEMENIQVVITWEVHQYQLQWGNIFRKKDINFKRTIVKSLYLDYHYSLHELRTYSFKLIGTLDYCKMPVFNQCKTILFNQD